jgi:predicted secreted hydrolase
VWVEDWIAQGEGAQSLPMHLRAADDAMAVDLRLDGVKPPVPQGDGGLSQKGDAPGDASYYYSLTRLATQGSVRIGQETFAVQGLTWMDHEWSTSVLEPGQSGWDWFALQLSDRREVMYYRLRRKDGSADPHSRGVIVDSRGGVHPLPATVQVAATSDWTSPHSGVRYPASWTLNDAADGLSLTVTPYLADQELNHRFRYWEGAVRAAGTIGGQAVRGEGYVELVGYPDSPASEHDSPARSPHG